MQLGWYSENLAFLFPMLLIYWVKESVPIPVSIESIHDQFAAVSCQA
jgi:hypothetical protein